MVRFSYEVHGESSFMDRWIVASGNWGFVLSIYEWNRRTVTDPSGAAVPNATVSIKNPDTGLNREVLTSGNGYYRLNSLPTASFEITVKVSGFEKSVQQNVELQAAQVKTVNFSLQIGATSSTVLVTATPPNVETSEGGIVSPNPGSFTKPLISVC